MIYGASDDVRPTVKYQAVVNHAKERCEQETEKSDINLEDFQKIGKNGPYDILDDKIAEYITTEQLNMFVLNGQPYLYRNGVYRRDEDGKILKAHIKALMWPDLVNISRINRVYNLILADYRLSFCGE